MGDKSIMKPFEKLVPRLDAMKIINENIHPIARTENLPINEAAGRVLSEKIVADFNVPPFDRSAMDGYAVIAEDTNIANEATSVKLNRVGILYAGEKSGTILQKGQCIEISTGSPIPKGANAVVMVEYTKSHQDIIEIFRKVKSGENIAPEGEDIKKGEIILKKGDFLTPGKLGSLAALGKTHVKVFVKPKVGVYSTGSEIIEPGTIAKLGQIFDINSYTLSAIIEENGCLPIKKGIIRDEESVLTKAVLESKEFDLVVFSGGSSVGSRDLLGNIVETHGQVYFHGLQVKPGKPTLFGKINNKPLFGMPGYPTSCLSNSYVFLIPALRKLSHLPPVKEKTVSAKLSDSIKSDGGREQFFTVTIVDGKAVPVFKQSGDITSMANADGFFIIPIGITSLNAGTEVNIILFYS
ncbi:molybdopterin molybdotransferase MoeA [Candidatus Bathyarchaeota archaeon]|nr:molybdopterin molybdotransferase MoeA [Candidatus Bathyarchaeota archaeon]